MKLLRFNKFTILLAFIFLGKIHSYAQEYTLVKQFNVNAIQLEVDHFGQFYIIEEFKISKYNDEGHLLSTFESIENGIISNVDVSDPLKPLIYFSDFSVLYILDNKLSVVNEVNLFDKEFSQIKFICNSSNSEFWIYDKQDNKLKRLDKNFELIQESESFINLFQNFTPPKKLSLFNNKIYILTQEEILVFDFNGVYIKKLALSKINNFQWIQNKIIYYKNNLLFSFDEKSFETLEMKIPKNQGEVLDIKILKKQILIFNKKNIILYSTK